MMASSLKQTQSTRIHPHKFILWVSMASIVMMFAGLTSAYIVRSGQANWLEFSLPPIFWVSTVVILCSSLTIQIALKSFKARAMKKYRMFITITAFLGVSFAVLQCIGFLYLNDHGVQLIWQGSNPSASFLGIITGLHILHVLGGVVALLVIFFRAYSPKTKSYSAIPIEVAATYWHFVDILWIYLFIFFNWMH